MLKKVLVAAALLVGSPVAAQDQYGADCFAELGGPELASAMADNLLADDVVENEPEHIRDLLRETAAKCMIANSIDKPALQHVFIRANLSYLVAGELDARLRSTGLNMEPIEALLTALVDDPQISIAEYIDARPALFKDEGQRAAAASAMTEDEIIGLVGSYIGVRLEQRAALAELAEG